MALALHKQIYSVEEYLDFERAADVRHEYWDGELYEMAGESTEHGIISVNLVVEIGQRLKGKPCNLFTKDVKVRSGAPMFLRRTLKGFFSYPDIVIVCGEMQFHDDARDVLLNPTIIIEVLSPGTEAFDRGEKFRRYRENLPTLKGYVLVAQNYPTIDLYELDEQRRWILTPVSGMENHLRLTQIDCVIPFAEIYDRITFPPPEELLFDEGEETGGSEL